MYFVHGWAYFFPSFDSNLSLLVTSLDSSTKQSFKHVSLSKVIFITYCCFPIRSTLNIFTPFTHRHLGADFLKNVRASTSHNHYGSPLPCVPLRLYFSFGIRWRQNFAWSRYRFRQLLTCFRRVYPVRISIGVTAVLIEVFLGVPQSLQADIGMLPRIGHDCSLPVLLIDLWDCPSTLYSLTIDRVLE
jgi:hypothetical protein